VEALEDDLVLFQQVRVLVGSRRHLVEERAQLGRKPAGDVLDHATDLEVARVHPLA